MADPSSQDQNKPPGPPPSYPQEMAVDRQQPPQYQQYPIQLENYVSPAVFTTNRDNQPFEPDEGGKSMGVASSILAGCCMCCCMDCLF